MQVDILCMHKHYLIPLSVIIVINVVLASCRKESITPDTQKQDELDDLLKKNSNNAGRAYYIMPSSTDYAHIPQDPKNPITDAKVDLGALLFHETGISLNTKSPEGRKTYSCASCHHAKAGFQAGVAQGLGEGGMGFGMRGETRSADPHYVSESVDAPMIRSPSAMNMAYQNIIMWNGQFGATGKNADTQSSWSPGTILEFNTLGYEGLETQAIAGQKVHGLKGDADLLKTNPVYRQLFDKAFPDLPAEQRISNITAGLAIAAYERTIISNEAPWQQWLKGDAAAMSETELKGAVLFFGKAACVSCHNGPALNSMEFYALGMNEMQNGVNGAIKIDPVDPVHKGRGGFTHKAADDYKFKVPQLYNLTDSKFYGHGGNFTTVKQVIDYKNKGIAQNSKVPHNALAAGFHPLNLTDEEVNQLTQFIEKSLYDPQLYRYTPASLPSFNCFPNADVQSKIDLNCN